MSNKKLNPNDYTPTQWLYYLVFEELPKRDLAEADLPQLMEILGTLVEREAAIIKMRCGIGYEEKMGLKAVGDTFGLSQPRIRQIEAKALRKLQHQSRAKHLKPLYFTHDEMKSELEAQIAERDQQISILNASNIALIAENQTLRSGYPAIQHGLESALRTITNYTMGCKTIQKGLEDAIKTISVNAIGKSVPELPSILTVRPIITEIDTLDFSIRATNCLKRAGITTLRQLIEYYASGDKLWTVRNLGRRCITEVEEKLLSLGVKKAEQTQQ